MSARDIPVQSRGASTPRVRARSRAVATRSDPSRCRWSSAFGIASARRRRGVVIRRCYDSARMSTILVTGADGFVGSWTIPALLRADHRVVAMVRTPDAGAVVRDRLPAAWRDRVETRIADVTDAGLAAAPPSRASTRSSTSWPSRSTGTAARSCTGSTPAGRATSSPRPRAAGVRRFIHMGALGVVDDPALHYASSKAKAEAHVRESGLDWTILKPSLQFGEGDGFFNIIADLVRMSPGIVPVPGDGRSRFQPIHGGDVAADRRPLPRGSRDGRRDVRAGRAALLDLPRDHRGGRPRAREAARASSRCPCR